jgi:hypothetical protein
MDALTPDQERWLGSQLWNELRNPLADRNGHGRNAWWDLPLIRKQSAHVAVKCGRCNGDGAIASFSLKYSGVCFACGGSGFRFISQAAYKKRKALRRAQAEQQSLTAVTGGEN